jgi:DNA-binding response OmpR family regulator
MLVEDDNRIVDFIQRGLKAEGYSIEVARNGQDAITLGSLSDFQAIILDLGLPDMNGRQVCESLRNLGVNTPILRSR